MARVLTVFGTRPEVIKLAPVVRELAKFRHEFDSVVGLTGQHDQLLKQALDIFGIRADFNLEVMRENQDLTDTTTSILTKMRNVLTEVKPDIVIVQGDTTTVFATALAAFYQRIMIGHVEAGLRTADKYQPFPEEINRRLTDQMSDLFFAPTNTSRLNLIHEGVPDDRIHVTGNTVVDALQEMCFSTTTSWGNGFSGLDGKIILVTAHRRENFGSPLESICQSIRKLAGLYGNMHFVYPVHPNPKVRRVAYRLLSDIGNVHLMESLDYVTFVHLMGKSYLILTDSGGIQEEAPALKKPVLVLREKTERPEVVAAGGAILVGTNEERIVAQTVKLIEDRASYETMVNIENPYGDGKAAQRIVSILRECL